MPTSLAFRRLLATAALAASALTMAVPANAAQRSFPVGSFSEIVLTGSHDVDVKIGHAASVSATGADADLDRLEIRVDGNRLLIGSKSGSWRWSRDGVKIHVSVPALSAAVISGSGEMDIDQVSGDFRGRISGSGDMDILSVESSTLELAISGSGDIDVGNGNCKAASYSTSGSGDIDASKVRCKTVTATTTGSGSISGYATDSAALRVTGSGDIEIGGGARCTTRTSGSGSTRCG